METKQTLKKKKNRRSNEGRIAKSSHRHTKNFCYFYIFVTVRSTMHNNIHPTTEITQSSEWLKPKEKRLFALSTNSHKTHCDWLKLSFRVGNLNECENETMKNVSDDSRAPTIRVYAYNKVWLSGFSYNGRWNKMWEMDKTKASNDSKFNFVQRTQMLSESRNIVIE